jgi:hypothetical protein
MKNLQDAGDIATVSHANMVAMTRRLIRHVTITLDALIRTPRSGKCAKHTNNKQYAESHLSRKFGSD